MTNVTGTVVHPLGSSISANNADAMLAEVEPVLAQETCRTLVLDCRRVRTCDSCGLRFLLSLQRKANALGKSLVLYRPDDILRQLLADTNLTGVFAVASDLLELG